MAIRLRPDVEVLRISPRQYVLRDPRTGMSFECGPDEHFLATEFDGQRSVEQVRLRFADRFGRQVSRRFADEFIEQLRTFGLLEGQRPTLLTRERIDPAAGARLNRNFDLLTLLAGGLVHWIWIVPILALDFLALNVLVRHYDWHTHVIGHWIARIGWGRFLLAILAVVFACVSLPTALMTGVACRKHGGRLRSFGVHWYRHVLPFWHCDIGESLTWMKQRGRGAAAQLSVALWTRLAIGGAAGTLLGMVRSGTPLEIFLLLLVGPCFVGVLLRLNVFAQYDTYALLSYFTDVPLLYERATAETRAWLTLRRAPEALSPRQRFWFRYYGLGALAWSAVLHVVVAAGLIWFMLEQAHGGSAALATTIGLLWYRKEIGRTAMSFSVVDWLVRGGGKWFIRWPLRLLALAAVAACGFIPYDIDVGGEARLVPSSEYGIRSQVAGQIASVNMYEGMLLAPGAVVATLDSREQLAAVEALQADLDQAVARLELLKAGARPEDVKALTEARDLAKVRLEYYEAEFQRMTDLASTNTVSESTLDNAKFNRDQADKQVAIADDELAKLLAGVRQEEIRVAEAEVEKYQVLIDQKKKDLELTSIHVPVGGRLVTAYVDARVGQYVQPGELIAVVKDTSKLRAEIAATEDAALRIRPGRRVNIRLWGNDGRSIQAHVESVAQEVSDENQSNTQRLRTEREQLLPKTSLATDQKYVRVYAELENPDEFLIPEMTGYARVTVEDAVLWQAIWRHISTFFRVEVWSWLP